MFYIIIWIELFWSFIYLWAGAYNIFYFYFDKQIDLNIDIEVLGSCTKCAYHLFLGLRIRGIQELLYFSEHFLIVDFLSFTWKQKAIVGKKCQK